MFSFVFFYFLDNAEKVCGIQRRDANGVCMYKDYTWKTIYLHTNGMFRKLFSELYTKIGIRSYAFHFFIILNSNGPFCLLSLLPTDLLTVALLL